MKKKGNSGHCCSGEPAVLKNSTWAVLGLTLEIELFTQEHYKQSIAPDDNLSELLKDIFLFHWKEETTHFSPEERQKLETKVNH